MRKVIKKYGIEVPRKDGTGTLKIVGVKYRTQGEEKVFTYFNRLIKKARRPIAWDYLPDENQHQNWSCHHRKRQQLFGFPDLENEAVSDCNLFSSVAFLFWYSFFVVNELYHRERLFSSLYEKSRLVGRLQLQLFFPPQPQVDRLSQGGWG